MKIFLFLIVAVLLLSILVTPIVEVFMAGKDKILLSSTLYNSFRAAREASFAYADMRDIDAVVDEKVFLECFADTFATSYGMDCTGSSSSPLRFVSYDGTFNDFEVSVNFSEKTGEGGAAITEVTVSAISQYHFRTRYMSLISYGDTNPYMLERTLKFIMRVTN